MKEFLLKIFFPKKCICCKKLDTYICTNCEKKITFIKSPTCIVCGKLSKNGKTCPKCRNNTQLTGVIISAYYEDGPLKEMIHIYKYENLKDLDKTLAGFLVKTVLSVIPCLTQNLGHLNKNKLLSSKTRITPIITYVPMHSKKEKQRGYNQSELLAKAVAEQARLELIENLLIKTKETTPQIELKRKDRLKNLKESFEINKDLVHKIKNKKIILVDDIVTTGTTLNECAKVLKGNGAKETWGLVIGKH